MRVVAQKPKLRCRFCRAFAVFDFRVHAGSALPLAAPAAPCALLSMILGRPAAPRMARVRGQGCELGLRPECRATEQGGVPWRCERSPCCWSRCLRGAGPRRAARVRSQARRRRGAASNAVGAPHAALRGASRPVAGARVSDARVRRKGSSAVKMPRQRVGAPPAASGGAPAPKRTPQAARRWVAARVTGRTPRAGRPPRRRDAETCVAAGSVVADAFLSCSWSIAAAPATTRRAAVGSCSPPRAPQTRLRKPSEPQPERLRPSLR